MLPLLLGNQSVDKSQTLQKQNLSSSGDGEELCGETLKLKMKVRDQQ